MSDHFNPSDVEVFSGHFINGERHTTSDPKIDVIRPSDLGVQGQLEVASESTVDQAVNAAHQAFHAGWGTMDPRARARLLKRWADLIDRDAEQIARLESVVSCRAYGEVAARDVRVVSKCLRFYGEYADKQEGIVTPTTQDILSLTVREPWGVVAAIVPWNFPLILSSWKFSPALAAGNTVVIKPSELTPYSLIHVAQLAIEAGIPPGVFNVVQGTGPQTGDALVCHPKVNYITFTGSTGAGAQVMSQSALNGIKPVSLELGGKGPQVVFADATNLTRVAALVAAGVTYNAGQVCFAGSRLVVESKLKDELIEKVQGFMSRSVHGPTWREGVTLPPTIHAQQAERIHSLVQKTVQEGATLVCGGTPLSGENGAYHYKPTILDGVTEEMSGYREELFGPVLCVQTFDNVEEAIVRANHPLYGLAASIYTANINTALRVARGVQAGTVWVNEWGRKADMTSPFGGYKQSGIGKDMGHAGFEKYLKSKSIWIQS